MKLKLKCVLNKNIMEELILANGIGNKISLCIRKIKKSKKI